MVIKFTCPNGHPLSAPENLSGKHGKCPKCATPFVVPQPTAAPDTNGEASEVTSGSATAPAGEIGTGSSKSGIKTGQLFVFLCPNGHKLNGPMSLKGKAGQCPHCGARFRIPSDEDLEQEYEEESPADAPEQEHAGMANFADFFSRPPTTTQHEEVADVEVEEIHDQLAPVPPGVHALGYIVGRLWDSKLESSELEIFLQEGEIMSPDRYCETLSTDQYGVFATLEGDGNYAITVIPWSSVRRVGMRNVESGSLRSFR